MNTEAKLIKLIEAGDEQAFVSLVRRYKTQVYSVSYSILGSREDADEISQDVFIKVHDSLHKFNGKSSFSTWLYRITVNKCRDALRKRKRKKEISMETDISGQEGLKLKDVLESEQKSADELMRDKELQEIVRTAIGTLPEKYRIAITLKEIEHLSYAEIADVMKVTVHNVKVILFRARVKLKERLRFLYEEA